jgi:ligand-binding SRPBCC domain-containing protein
MSKQVFEKSVLIKAPVDQVFAFCSSRRGFERHFPYRVRWSQGPENWREGTELTFKFRYLGLWLNYVTRVVRYEVNRCFVDEMISGPYRSFVHTHSFRETEEGTLYTDRVEFSTGFGGWIDRYVALRQIRAAFEQRHRRMKAFVEAGAQSREHGGGSRGQES